MKIGKYTHWDDDRNLILNDEMLYTNFSGITHKIFIQPNLEKPTMYDVTVVHLRTQETVYGHSGMKPKTVLSTFKRFLIPFPF